MRKHVIWGCLSVVIIAASGCSTTANRAVDTSGSQQEVAIEERIRVLDERIAKVEKSQSWLTRSQLRRKFEARVECDRKTYKPEELKEIETLYQRGNKEWGGIEHKDALKLLVEKYPKSNRAGCAMLYLGQLSEGEEREKYFRKAVAEHNDCWYGDGVQVGAYARFYLIYDYLKAGKTDEAKQLCGQLDKEFPEAVDHRGRPLADKISSLVPAAGSIEN